MTLPDPGVTTPPTDEQRALDVACPVCASSAGKNCYGLDGSTRPPHIARMKAAQ